MQVHNADFQGADALEKALFKGAAHAHGLAGGLHLGAQTVVGIGELIEGEPGHFGDHIVKSRLKGGAGVGKTNLVQGHAHADLRGDPGDWVAGGLGSQSGTPGNPGVYLDEVILEGIGIQRKLDVAAALNAKRPDELQGRIPEHVVFLVGQGLGRADHDGVAGVDAHGIQVLHVADGDGGVIGIPHDLILDFLVALDALLNQHLVDRGEHQGIFHDFPELFLIVGKAAAGAAQSKGGAQNHGIADFLGSLQAFVHGAGNLRGEHRLAQALTQLLEQFPILGLLDASAGSAQQLRPAFPENALLFQLHGKVQTGLTADAGYNGIRPFVPDDSSDIFQGQRLHIDLIRNGRVGHNGGRVGVAQNHLVALFFQCQAGLSACVVKFRGLADDNGAGADDQNFMNVCPLRHVWFPPSSG